MNRAALMLPLVLAAGCTALRGAASRDAGSRDAYSVRRLAAGLMVVDGESDEPAWESAGVMDRFQTAGPAPVGARVATSVRLV